MSAEEIAAAFVQHYYTTLDTNPGSSNLKIYISSNLINPSYLFPITAALAGLYVRPTLKHLTSLNRISPRSNRRPNFHLKERSLWALRTL